MSSADSAAEMSADSILSDPIVTAAERDALMDEPGADEESQDTWGPVDGADSESVVDAPDEPVVLTAEDVPNWGEVRARVARMRRPPRRILDAA